jgi:hypothetical protein
MHSQFLLGAELETQLAPEFVDVKIPPVLQTAASLLPFVDEVTEYQ